MLPVRLLYLNGCAHLVSEQGGGWALWPYAGCAVGRAKWTKEAVRLRCNEVVFDQFIILCIKYYQYFYFIKY